MTKKTLSDTTRAIILKRWNDGERNKTYLARQYGTSARTIGRIVAASQKATHKLKVADDKFKVGDLLVRKNTNDTTVRAVLGVDHCSKALDIRLEGVGWVDGKNYECIGTKVAGVMPKQSIEQEVKQEPINPVYTITPMCVMLSIEGNPRVIDATHPLFKEISDDVIAGRFNAAFEKMDIKTAIEKYSEGFLKIEKGQVMYNGMKVTNKLGQKIVNMMADGNEGFKAFATFFVKAMENPSKDSREQLMGFVAADDITISEDGEIYAYKNVKEDFKPSRVGMYDENGVYHADKFYTNRVGDVCSMPRGLVEDDKNITCAHGLHIASLHYLASCWGFSGHNMLVKVHPRDVVAIPTDYNNSKGRVCRYEVVAELSKEDIEAALEKLKK